MLGQRYRPRSHDNHTFLCRVGRYDLISHQPAYQSVPEYLLVDSAGWVTSPHLCRVWPSTYPRKMRDSDSGGMTDEEMATLNAALALL